MRLTAHWLCLLLIPAAIACGKRDDPTPPVPVIPEATSDLVVAQRGSQLILGWSYPKLTTAGRNIPAVDAIEVRRLVETLPPDTPSIDQIPLPPASGAPWERQLFEAIPAPTETRFNRDAEIIATLARDRIPASVAGARVIFVDEPPLRADDGRPVRLSYSVRTLTGDTWSSTGNIVHVVPLELSGPPRNLRAEAAVSAVQLQWDPPADSDERPPVGYFVYRFGDETTSIDPGTPLTQAPVSGTSYSDTPPYGRWSYAVTAVRDAGPPAVESRPTDLVTVEFSDRQPPAAPAEVLTLLEDPAVRIVWNAVEASDLAGYHVYRSVEGGERVRLTTEPVTELILRDESPPRGATYVYAVTSVDVVGNESEATAAAPVVIPPG